MAGSSIAIDYPVAVPRSFVNLFVNIPQATTPSGTVDITLLKTGSATALTVQYLAGEFGPKSILGVVPYAPPDTFDLLVVKQGAAIPEVLRISATLGVE